MADWAAIEQALQKIEALTWNTYISAFLRVKFFVETQAIRAAVGEAKRREERHLRLAREAGA